jgi:hypothetical protein
MAGKGCVIEKLQACKVSTSQVPNGYLSQNTGKMQDKKYYNMTQHDNRTVASQVSYLAVDLTRPAIVGRLSIAPICLDGLPG